jgi:hypothetical protein
MNSRRGGETFLPVTMTRKTINRSPCFIP